MTISRRLRKTPNTPDLLTGLSKAYPNAGCALNFTNAFELLVATVLSAQCTDARVNAVTPSLFKALPTPLAMSQAPLAEIEELIRSTGFFRSKAKSLSQLSQALVKDHNGVVPKTLEALTKLRGVGRKTANVVLGNAYGIPGITVDTHLGRLARRMGMTRQTDPVKVEFDLQKIVPEAQWTTFSHQMIAHGRAICAARKPKCATCPIETKCPKIGI